MAKAILKPDEILVKKVTKEIHILEGKLAEKKGLRRNIEETIILTISKKEGQILYDFLGHFSSDAMVKLGFSKEDDVELYKIYDTLVDVL